MTKITEIIPDDIPDWAIEAMADGQLFNVTFARIKKLTAERDEAYEKIKGIFHRHLHEQTRMPASKCNGEVKCVLNRTVIDEVLTEIRELKDE